MKQESQLKIRGVVLKRVNGDVEIEISKPVECTDCGTCFSGTEKTVRIPTSQTLHPGDGVWLLISCSAISGISFLLYFLPAVFTLMGFIAGYLWKGDLGGFVGALIFVAAGYLSIRKYSQNKYKHSINIEIPPRPPLEKEGI